MKATFQIHMRSHTPIKAELGLTRQMTFGKNSLTWEFDANNHISLVRLHVSGLPIMQNSAGAIECSSPETLEQGYEFARKVADALFIATGVDAFDPAVVLLRSPELEAENSAEDLVLRQNSKSVLMQINGTALIVTSLADTSIRPLLEKPKAISSYADALRATNPIVKFEQFYKVIEHSFVEKNTHIDLALDRAVAAHAVKINRKFDESAVANLRDIRNRCIHPQKPGHINPANLAALQELNDTLSDMRDLAKLLIENPPT